tara:strand:- start:899 stop:1249 length:351 start_codon:yes stop_codon:yes gene_type:complete
MLLLSGYKMEESNYKEWSVDFNGKIIKVSNWWNWEGKCSADLYLDNEHLHQNTDILVNPNKAMLFKSDVSDDIKSIEVFSAGLFSVKLLIMVNGVVVLQDKLSLLDRFAKSFFSKK